MVSGGVLDSVARSFDILAEAIGCPARGGGTGDNEEPGSGRECEKTDRGLLRGLATIFGDDDRIHGKDLFANHAPSLEKHASSLF